MSAQQRRVENVAEYLEQVSIIKKQWPNSVLAFRGQEDERWGLESSAERRLKNSRNPNSISQGKAAFDQLFVEYHQELLKKCKLKNYDRQEGKPLHELELLAELQHHGAATCLIDFTRTALVALWFACERTGRSDSDGKVFLVNINDNKAFLEIAPVDIGKPIENILKFETRETSKDEDQRTKSRKQENFKISPDKPDFWHWTPAHLNERIIAQHSLFLFGLPSVSEQLPSEKIIIESENKDQIRQELKEIHDIHEESLFPDFVGFAYTQRHSVLYYLPDAEEYFRRGVEAHQRGDLYRAIQDSDKAIALKPDDAKAYYNRGVAYGEKGDHDHALQDFDKAIALKLDNAKAYYNRGVAYTKKGEFARAIQDYGKAIDLKPDNAEAYYNRGTVYGKKGDLDRAIQDFDKAIDLKPDDADAYNNRGVAYRKKDDLDRALQDYDKAIALKPDNAEVYDNRGLAYAQQSEFARAIQDFDRAIALKPDLAMAYNNRGSAYVQQGEFARAIQDFDKAIELEPDAAEFYNNRGSVYWAGGDLNRAIQDYDKAIALKPDLAEAYYLRGVTWLFLKKWDKARSDLTAAKNRGLDIVGLSSSTFGSVSNFEQTFHVQVPDDIAEMLTP